MKKEKLKIIFEDKNILVIDKPSKLLCIATDKEKEHTLYHDVLDYLHKKNQKGFIVHRLDKDTSGLVVFAKNENAKEIMQNNWENVKRKYIAVVEGIIKEKGFVESYLKETKTLFTYSSNDKDGKYAKTIYNPLKGNRAYTMLDIELVTGRKNQIRVHMNDLKHPIIGDKKYNAKRNPIGRLGLHAYYLEFHHPVTDELLKLESKVPKEFDLIFKEQ